MLVLHVIIKNFGKVESADISLNNLVFFVGDNNSGKTMVMQLIYGIRKELAHFQVPVSGVKQSDSNDQCLIRCDQEWFREVEMQINRYLAENKSRIIENIFGSPIPVEEIKIGLDGIDSVYFVSSVSEWWSGEMGEQKKGIHIDTRQYENRENVKSFEDQISDFAWSNRKDSDAALEEVLKIVWRIILSKKAALDSEQLFLPASRAGLQLLYKHYFAGEAEGNMVMPVKDFLRFLQLYVEDKQLNESRRELLQFGEEHLLQGKVVQKNNDTFYMEEQENRIIPLYIASSMIHELAPFIMAMNATQRIEWLYCDEVENSLHPLLQGEMARWLIRMANAGIHVMISSHSDTMASRLNNLFMLTQLYRKTADYKILSELGLLEADLLRPDVNVEVYEFQNGKQRKTVVKKMEFISYPLMGYDFELFSKNLDKLYDEADRITR